MTKDMVYMAVHGYLREVYRREICMYMKKNHFLSRDFDKWNQPEKAMVSASITLAGFSGSLMLESHFVKKDVAELMSRMFDRPIKNITDTEALDYVREYINCVAGAVRRVLIPNQLQFERAIPSNLHTCRHDCEKLFKTGNINHSGIWVLTDGQIDIVCIAHVSLTKLVPFKSAIPKLAMSLFEQHPTGEVEFLF